MWLNLLFYLHISAPVKSEGKKGFAFAYSEAFTKYLIIAQIAPIVHLIIILISILNTFLIDMAIIFYELNITNNNEKLQ
jgi:hypothetical protein